MQKNLIVDSSTLFALERVSLIKFLDKIDHEIIIPKAVEEEIKKGKSKLILSKVKIEELRGRSLKLSRGLEKLGIGKGEAQCCSLANKLKLNFIVCDDRKFIRQKFFSSDRKLRAVKVVGFSFFLNIFYKKGLINNVWNYFNKIIKQNNWERSEVQVANYVFLKEREY